MQIPQGGALETDGKGGSLRSQACARADPASLLAMFIAAATAAASTTAAAIGTHHHSNLKDYI